MVNAIELKQVSKHFTRDGAVTQALSDIDLTIEPGSFVSLIGPSGCGKSTMLRLIAGLAFPDGGRVAARGEAVTGPGADRGFMFQEHNLFPWLTISENIGHSTESVLRKYFPRQTTCPLFCRTGLGIRYFFRFGRHTVQKRSSSFP